MSEKAVKEAMKGGIEPVVKALGVLKISAGNFSENLRKLDIRLLDVF